MIEVVSAPQDLTAWDENHPPFYLELYGETRPSISKDYARVVIGEGDRESPGPGDTGRLYQYWWTIGHSTDPEQWESIWSKLQDEVAGRVYLFFPRSGGWRIKELVATVNYLHPFRERTTFWNTFAEDWKSFIAPGITGASSLAGAVPNPILAGASSILGTIAKLQVNSVPQVADFEWSVGKITTRHQKFGVMQGIMWTLPKKMFTDLGSRLTGSIALSFIPAHVQQPGVVEATEQPLLRLPILAHAVIYKPHHSDNDLWVPGQQEFIELYIEPRYGQDDASS